MKAKKIIYGVLAIMVTFSIIGCGKDKKEEKVEDSNVTSNKEETEEEIENETSNIPGKKYIKMDVKSKEDGSITTYDVDNYSVGMGGTVYYYTKDNYLYRVDRDNPEVNNRIASGIKYVLWDNNAKFIAIADINAKIIDNESKYISYVYSDFNRTLTVTSMDDGSTKDYIVNCSAQGEPSAGLSNHYYYVKGDELYYINGSNIENSIKIATGVKYVGFSSDDAINGFAAFITKDFKYVDESSAYLLKTFKLYY